MIVEYSPGGQVVSDFEVLDFVRAAWAQGEDIQVSSELVLVAFRVLVRRGEIPPYRDGVVFRHKDLCRTYEIQIDQNGECPQHLLGWAGTAASLLYELI